MACKILNTKEAALFLKQNDRFLILTHALPDGDTLGSAFALESTLKNLGKKARVLCPDEIPSKFLYLTTDNDLDFEPEIIVAVDVADKKLLGKCCDLYGDKIDLCIDHHHSNKGFAKRLYLEGDSASACECIYNVIEELGTEITPHIADCLYTGIATDTGCFKFSNTSPRTHRYAATLIEKGANFGEINRVMFEVKSRSQIAVEKQIFDSIEFHSDGKIAVVVITNDMLNAAGTTLAELDGITALARSIDGVLIGITVKEIPSGKVRASVRTFEPYSASEICAVFGGGGHERAAGCEFSYDIAQAKQMLIKTAKEVMARD
jgi:phosphoesterase RecJ-like protein